MPCLTGTKEKIEDTHGVIFCRRRHRVLVRLLKALDALVHLTALRLALPCEIGLKVMLLHVFRQSSMPTFRLPHLRRSNLKKLAKLGAWRQLGRRRLGWREIDNLVELTVASMVLFCTPGSVLLSVLERLLALLCRHVMLGENKAFCLDRCWVHKLGRIR